MATEKSFELPMSGAQAFWHDKVQMSKAAFNRLDDEAKLRAFAVSGIAKGDELATVFAALQRAIDQGESFADFKKSCREIFERRGWHGKRAWRIDNIYRTNLQTAYSVGRYQRLVEVKGALPYWQYSAVGDRRTRPTHLAMNGRVYPADHPVWNRWYPPNGYRCRCSVIALSETQVEERGLAVETDDPTDLPIMGISPVTGQEELMPRQMIPAEGFESNPGLSWWSELERQIEERLASYPAALAELVAADLAETRVAISEKAAEVAQIDENEA